MPRTGPWGHKVTITALIEGPNRRLPWLDRVLAAVRAVDETDRVEHVHVEVKPLCDQPELERA